VPEDGSLPSVQGDEERLGQLLVNLLHNAVKFSPEGSQVVVRAAVDGADVVVSVEDHGSGIPRADLEAAWMGAAQPIADTPGLQWKVWLMNEAENEAGGIYLFDSKQSAHSYMSGPIVAALKASPAITDISAKLFDVLEEHTAVTRGPLGAVAAPA